MIQIKLIEARDVPSFVSVHLDCWKETYGAIFPSEVFEVRVQKREQRIQHITDRLQTDSYFYFALYDDFHIVGILIFSILDGIGLLDALYLKKEYQGQGYGTSLLKVMEEVFLNHQISEYHVYVSPLLSANAFFEKRHAIRLGFDYVSIHGKDYIENEYVVKVGDNLE